MPWLFYISVKMKNMSDKISSYFYFFLHDQSKFAYKKKLNYLITFIGIFVLSVWEKLQPGNEINLWSWFI